MHARLRYLAYGMILVLGACAYAKEQSRTDWEAIAASANAAGSDEDSISSVGRGGKR